MMISRQLFCAHLDFGRDAVGDLVVLPAGGGVGLGQEARVRLEAVLGLHQLEERKEHTSKPTTTNRRGGGGVTGRPLTLVKFHRWMKCLATSRAALP